MMFAAFLKIILLLKIVEYLEQFLEFCSDL